MELYQTLSGNPNRLHLPVSEICICNGFPRGHYLVWWVRVRVKFSLGVRVSGMIRVMVDVRVRFRVSNLLGSDYGHCEFRVIIRVRVGVNVRP